MKDVKEERDASVDRLLAATLRTRADAPSSDACLDAETLAAWADGALDARERARLEAHAADCARCQAMLAAMVATMPAPAEAASRWRFPALGWLVPLTAAATALVIWIAVPNRAPVQVSNGVAEPVEQASPLADAKAKTELQTPREAATERDAAAAAPPSADVREKREAAAPEKQASPAAPATANAASEAATLAAPAAQTAADADAPSRRQAAAAPAAAPSPDAQARRELRFAGYSQIVSSNPSTRFRLLSGGGVQRTADAGATWRTEVTGATETLTAGSSPSPSVCWLVGPSGAVFLSTDGRSWNRVRFPEAVDLNAVMGTDGESATVRTADGRLFSTTDGGQTWSRTQGP